MAIRTFTISHSVVLPSLRLKFYPAETKNNHRVKSERNIKERERFRNDLMLRFIPSILYINVVSIVCVTVRDVWRMAK
jgi:hypothetical protein